MEKHIIRPAKPRDLDFAKDMMIEAGHGLIERFYGSGSEKTARKVIEHLWTGNPNRLHFKNCHVLEVNKQKLGFLSSYPVGTSKFSSIAVMRVFKAGGFKLFFRYITRLRELKRALTIPEGMKGEYYIFTVAAPEEARGKGIGSKLMQLAIDQAKSLGMSKVSLVVTKDNDGAIKLYERLGFVIDTSKKGQHNLVVRMVLDISNR